MKKKIFDSIDIKTPCNESWDEMFGNDEVRFCSHCAKDVHNLSAMTRRKAEELVKKSNGKLCVRYVRNPNGEIIIAPPQLFKIKRQAAIAAGVLASSLAFSTLTYAQGEIVKPKDDSTQTNTDKKNETTQKLSTISGLVSDELGAIIPGVKLTLKNLKTKKSVTITSDTNGNYSFTRIADGVYKLKIEFSGFKTLNFERFEVSGNLEKDIVLTSKGTVEMGVFVINTAPQTKNKKSEIV